MSMGASQETSTAAMVRALSLLLAMLLWACVVVERPGRTSFEIPLRAERLPPGLRLASSVPGKVLVTVSGPRILLWQLPYRDLSCSVDLTGSASGAGSVLLREDSVLLPSRELKVERIFPACVALTLEKNN